MSDIAFEQLRQQMGQHISEPALWVVDENLSANDIASVAPRETLELVTNRCDVYEQLLARGFTVRLSDFDFSAYPSQHFKHIYYRVSKEKPVVHHVINQASRLLVEGGFLYLSGYKKDGTKTYIDKAAKYLGSLIHRTLGGKTAMLAQISYDGDAGKPLGDKDYPEHRVINPKDTITFLSKPGVYGWNKIDKGSAFLIKQLSNFLTDIDRPIETVADLGCGYGYLSIMAAQQLQARFFSCDNNIAAVNCCRKNFLQHNVSGEVILDNAGSSVVENVDLVLCNPPFHQGFDVEGDLTEHFLQAAAGLLKPKGIALFVVNAFIPLERKAAVSFTNIELIDNNGSFKVMRLQR